MSDFRVVLYSSMSKLWLNCVKKCAWISIVFPLINSVVLTGCALSYPSVINCNWLEEGSVARNFIPNGNITTENTFVIILICFLLDILRVQITILTICALHWIIRNPVADFIITYACIFTTYVISYYKCDIQHYKNLKQRNVNLHAGREFFCTSEYIQQGISKRNTADSGILNTSVYI